MAELSDPAGGPDRAGKSRFYGVCASLFAKRRGTILKRAKNMHRGGGKMAQRGFFAIYGKIVPREMGVKRAVLGQFLVFFGQKTRGRNFAED